MAVRGKHSLQANTIAELVPYAVEETESNRLWYQAGSTLLRSIWWFLAMEFACGHQPRPASPLMTPSR
jgi:hypothetical protein